MTKAETSPLDDLKAKIRRHAMRSVRNHDLTIANANTRLRAMGIVPVPGTNTYTYKVDTTADTTVKLSATDRAAAEKAATEYVTSRRHRLTDASKVDVKVSVPEGTPTLTLIDGPEDFDPTTLTDGAPADVESLKEALKTTLLDMVVSGEVCSYGVANEFTAFELGEYPEAQTFYVDVPVTGMARFPVTAFDEASAVAGALKQATKRAASRDHIAITSDADITGDAVLAA